MLSHADIDTYYQGSKNCSCSKAVFSSLIKKMQVFLKQCKKGGRSHGTGSFEFLWINLEQVGVALQCCIRRSSPDKDLSKSLIAIL